MTKATIVQLENGTSQVRDFATGPRLNRQVRGSFKRWQRRLPHRIPFGKRRPDVAGQQFGECSARVMMTYSCKCFIAEQRQVVPEAAGVPAHQNSADADCVREERLLFSGSRWRSFRAECPLLPTRRLFLMLGTLPNTGRLGNCLQLDEKGFVITGPEVKATWLWSRSVMMLETSVPGVFGASDVRAGSVKPMASP